MDLSSCVVDVPVDRVRIVFVGRGDDPWSVAPRSGGDRVLGEVAPHDVGVLIQGHWSSTSVPTRETERCLSSVFPE